jgi:nucleotide-binding universal stress UspA family protein
LAWTRSRTNWRARRWSKASLLASAAGFAAEGRTARGKSWRAICDVAEELDAATIVVGARGLSRLESVLLGSVSSAVAVHAKRPVLIVPPPRGDGT